MFRFLIIALLFFSACSSNDKYLTEFNQHLGTEKAATLDRITSNFEDFLGLHFPDQPDFHMQFCYFIDDLAQNKYDYIQNYYVPDSVASVIINNYENSGLALALPIKVIDRTADTPTILYDYNLVGAYHKALLKVEDNDFINSYVALIEKGDDLKYPLLIPPFLDYCMNGDFNDPIIKRIAALEYYMLIIYMSAN